MITDPQKARHATEQTAGQNSARNAGRLASRLTLTLFGAMTVRLEDGTLLPPLRTRKGFYLLALLALRGGREVERNWLAATLWPESGEALALSNLRRTLTDLRAALGDAAECITAPAAHTLCLDLSEGVQVDLAAFDKAVKRGDAASLQEAIALYSGPLLEGCSETWVFPERDAREQSYLAALEAQVKQASVQTNGPDAILALRRILAVDPLRETAQRDLMEALAQQGNFAAVTQVYRDLRLYLHRELNVEPAPETQALYERLRRQSQEVQLPPAPAGMTSPPFVLPCTLSSFVGREQERSRIGAQLEAARLVSLIGAGGVGKTRLAIEVGRECLPQYPDGVWFVDLAPLSDPLLVPQTVARTLKLQKETEAPVEMLTTVLYSRELLLILDNCEHLLDACTDLAARLLAACPKLRILVTSRQPLGILGEVALRIASLSSPDPMVLRSRDKNLLSGLMEFEAVRLFVERARLVFPSFRLTRDNAEPLIQICRRLDGIPLALELAAARAKMLSVEQIAARLDDCFRLLTGGSRTALTRQQTLQAAMDWSYHLLTDAERTLFRRLSVFAGGWTLEAAEAVASDKDEGGRSLAKDEGGRMKDESDQIHPSSFILHPSEVLDLLTALVDKSLVMVTEESGGMRYRLLETGRQYSRERLLEAGEEEDLRRRHGDCFLALAEEAEPNLVGTEQVKWLARLESEHDNLRAALSWSADSEARLRLAGALWRYWYVRGYFAEGRSWLANTLEHGREASLTIRTKALGGAGILAAEQGDLTAACVYLEEHVAIMSEHGSKLNLAHSLNNLGKVRMKQKDYTGARPLLEHSLALKREMGNQRGIAQSLGNLGQIAEFQDDLTTARLLHLESLAISRELNDTQSIAWSLYNLGSVAHDRRNDTEAGTLIAESLGISGELEDRQSIAAGLSLLAEVEVTSQPMERVARLIGAAEFQYKLFGNPLPSDAPGRFAQVADAARAVLGEEAFRTVWQEGYEMTTEQAIAFACDVYRN